MNTNTLPRPTRRPRRALVELTDAGLIAARAHAEHAVSAALDAYSDAGAAIQEGAIIAPAQWDTLGANLSRSTRRVALCAKLIAA